MGNLPTITLPLGQRYFSIDGRQRFIFLRNLATIEKEDFARLLDWMTFDGSWADYSGTRVARVNVESWAMRWQYGSKLCTFGYDSQGNLAADWDNNWKEVFGWGQNQPDNRSLYFMPVITGWYNWNKTYPNNWDGNPLNEPTATYTPGPTDLFDPKKDLNKRWFKWLGQVVTSWRSYGNILAWEIYSEINLTNGITPQAGIAFIERAANFIHKLDKLHRPITASLAGRYPDWALAADHPIWSAGDPQWGDLYRSPELDFIQIHPYPAPHEDLGGIVLEDVPKLSSDYSKPVLIGESGLNGKDIDSPLGVGLLANAHLGLEHAVWSAAMSGAMNGRAFWGEDGYAIFVKTMGWNFLQRYAEIERSVARFMYGIDTGGLEPVGMKVSSNVTGAALKNANLLIGWLRDAGCQPPNWHLEPQITNPTVILYFPRVISSQTLTVEYYDTNDGVTTWPWQNETVKISGQRITLKQVPAFTNDIAFKINLNPSAQPGSIEKNFTGENLSNPGWIIKPGLGDILRYKKNPSSRKAPIRRK